MKFASLLVTVGVYAAKIWIEFYSTKVAPRCHKSVWQCCSSVKCGTMWFIVLFVAGLFVTGVLVAVALFTKPVQKVPETLNEVSYDMAYVFILTLVLPIFFPGNPLFGFAPHSLSNLQLPCHSRSTTSRDQGADLNEAPQFHFL